MVPQGLGVYNNTDLCISTLLCNFSTYMPNMQDKGQNINTKKTKIIHNNCGILWSLLDIFFLPRSLRK
jgi:hypothetical protein